MKPEGRGHGAEGRGHGAEGRGHGAEGRGHPSTLRLRSVEPSLRAGGAGRVAFMIYLM